MQMWLKVKIYSGIYNKNIYSQILIIILRWILKIKMIFIILMKI
jgi:hypothetical protein